MKILFASGNLKKTAEIQRMAPEGIEIICLKDVAESSLYPEPEENGKTFLENSRIKAKYWAGKLQIPVIAEDSGICIDALNGYPGVYTKRCVKDLCPESDVNVDNPSELYPLLLDLINKSESKNTSAKWYSAITAVVEENEIGVEEFLEGDMCPCGGEKEFGFDQYFKAKGYKKTLAELSFEEKDSIGPRKRAFIKVLNELVKYSK